MRARMPALEKAETGTRGDVCIGIAFGEEMETGETEGAWVREAGATVVVDGGVWKIVEDSTEAAVSWSEVMVNFTSVW